MAKGKTTGQATDVHELVIRKMNTFVCEDCYEEELAEHPEFGADWTEEWYPAMATLAKQQGWLMIPAKGDRESWFFREFRVIGPKCAARRAQRGETLVVVTPGDLEKSALAAGPGEWVDRDGFALPAIPSELAIDPLFAALLHCVAFLELSDDDAVNPDWAVEAMEHVAMYLEQLQPSAVAVLEGQLGRLAAYARQQQWPAEVIGFIDDFPLNFGLDEDDE